MFFSYKKSNLIISLITFLLFCSVLFAAAYAFPQMPTNFYGYVYLGAENHTATTGTNITAKIDNTIFSSNLTYNGNFYSLLVPTDDSDISGKDGAETDDNISLFVIDIYSNSWVFTGPGHSRQLDLYINRPPVLDPITDITITEEETATINPSATDIDGDTITYSVNDTSRFTENSPPFNWVTDYDDAGVYIVRVTASDSEMIDYQDITVTVTNKNRAPVASATSTTTDEDTAKAITLSATDADDDSMTYSIVSAPSHGTLSGTIPELTYTPDENYNGADSFTFNANDGTVNSTAATISITVTAVNDAPTIDPEVTDIETPEDTVATLDLTQFENDVEDSDTFLTWTIGGVNTAIFTASIDKSTDVLTITPISDANGADTVTLTLTDSGDATATQDIIVTVTAVNDAPEASDGSALTDEDTAKAITLSATDADGNSLTYAL
ncbi:MAG: hypothetical protein GQ477_04960, partial [Nanohaloarchaea archaeon]|nr:hypothetical protein [Candidatus Nanohaloarchaea archaeon]